MLIAKQMDIRSNIKKYFDMAFEGEAIVVPRKMERNVVIISENEYNRLIAESHIETYARGVTKNRAKNKTVKSGEVLKHNLDKLETIGSMKANWNGNGAPAFSGKLIEKAKKLIKKLFIQPEVFPTALGTIQLEYDNARRDHMEIEIGLTKDAEVFTVLYNGEERLETIASDNDSINRLVGEFYG